jgi:hypothetical protein
MKDKEVLKMLALQKLPEANGDIKLAMREAGLPKSTISAKFITSSPEYKKIIQKYFNDEFLDEAFGKVFNSGKLESFRVAKDIDVQGIAELKEVVESINGKWVGIQSTPLGKFAYYYTSDTQSILKALDMAAKIRGAYAPVKVEVSEPAQIIGVRVITQSEADKEDEIKQIAEIQSDDAEHAEHAKFDNLQNDVEMPSDDGARIFDRNAPHESEIKC